MHYPIRLAVVRCRVPDLPNNSRSPESTHETGFPTLQMQKVLHILVLAKNTRAQRPTTQARPKLIARR